MFNFFVVIFFIFCCCGGGMSTRRCKGPREIVQQTLFVVGFHEEQSDEVVTCLSSCPTSCFEFPRSIPLFSFVPYSLPGRNRLHGLFVLKR